MRVFTNDPDLTDEERSAVRERNIKYALVRFLYMEKMKGTGLLDFHFSPGDSFMETPTIDVVNTLVDTMEKIASGEIECVPLDFGDRTIFDSPEEKAVYEAYHRGEKSNPPVTGRPKTKIL